MRKLLTAEYRKTRGRYMLLTTLGITTVELVWMLGGDLSEDAILKGWMMLLFQMPLINALFLPILAIVVSSRLGDLEHKSGMLKEQCCMVKRGSFYDAKLLYGSMFMLISIVVTFCVTIAYGYVNHFGGALPVKEYLLLFLFTVTATGVIYLLQHTLAICCKKTVIPFAVGIVGEFTGVLSMFLPSIPFLRKSIPWGYYGMMMFVGSDYDRATRISTYYMFEIDWGGFCLMLVVLVVLYPAGRKLFGRMDL